MDGIPNEPMIIYACLPHGSGSNQFLRLDPRQPLPEGLTEWDLDILKLMLDTTLEKIHAQLLKISMIQAQNESSR